MHFCLLKGDRKMKQRLMLLWVVFLVFCFMSVSLGADKSMAEEQLVKELY